MAGWILVERETDEFYGRVQWRNEQGAMINKFEIVEMGFKGKYVFSNSGKGELIIIK